MKKNLLLKFSTLLTIAGLFCTSMVFGQATLKHSYTFEEGTFDETTVYDQAGSVDGILGGTKISIADGKATVSGATANNQGWISLDGVALALNTYSAVTLEAFVETGEVLNAGYTMLAYFGTSTPGSGCLWMQPTRSGNETRIETNNLSSTVTAAYAGYEVDDGKMHHLVAVLNDETLTYYIDGVVVAESATGADYVSTIGTDVANLFRGVDGWNDPNYNASLLEFNIYDGTLDQHTIASTAGEFLGLDLTNPNLTNLTTSVGTMSPEYDPETDIYEIYVPYGTTELTLTATPVVNGVTITMLDGLGNELENGLLTFDKDDGIDVEVMVTALDGVSEASYFVSVFPEDGTASATLGNIELSAGSFTTEFNMDDTSYVAIVPPGTTSVDVTGVPNWDNATVDGNGTVTLVDGMGTATLTVTSEDGNSTMVYTVGIYESIVTTDTDFYLVHELSGFVAAESGASFNQVILADAIWDSGAQLWHFEDSGVDGQFYIVNKDGNYMCLSRTSANIWDLEVYPDLPAVGLDSARFMLNEFEPGRFRIISVRRQQASSTNYRLGPNNGNLGSPLFSDKWRSAANDPLTVFNIKKPEDVASPYEIHLDSLSVNGVSLKPVFNTAIKSYFITVPVGMSSVEVVATPTNPAATVTGAGTVDVSDGQGTITITVTAAEDAQYTREYVINYIADTELTLMHSYTFDDGTANDQVGDADGTVNGGTIVDGTFVAAEEGDYIVLPAEKIALNTYPSFTMEMHVTTGANPGWTMYSYFGNTSGGSNCFFVSLAGNNNQARAVLNLGNGEVQAASTEPGTGEVHHYVSVVSNDTIYWYVDGELAQKTPSDYLIRNIAGTTAWLGYGAYNDPTWLGTTNEFDIYKGQMDAATVAERAALFLGDISRDATLASLTLDAGDLLPAFDPSVTNYSVIIPEGTTEINVTAVPNDAKSTVEGDGTIDVSSGSASAAIVVTAENGAKITYNIEFNTPSEYTLMHSYTFNDGTADDVVGGLNGLVSGNVTIANGMATVDTAANGEGQDYGYIALDGAALALNSYSAITTEAFIVAGDGANDSYTMLYYFGDNTTNYLFSQMTQGTTDATVKTTGADGEVGAWFGSIIDDGMPHHIVAVVTSTSLKFYVDGILVDSGTGTGMITPIGTMFANLFRGPDGWNDDNWIGSMDEFNIYNGEMDAATVKERADQYLSASELTLMHSYPFEDGTANDVVGNLDGTLNGAVTVADGKATVDPAANGQGQNYGYISFDGDSLALNTYSAITTEAYIVAGDGTNDSYTMMYYFGDNTANYLFSQMTEGGGDVSNVKTTTTGGEKGVAANRIDDGLKHHIVAVITSTSVSYYVDGVLRGTTSGEGFITPIGTQFAHLFRGPDGWNDDNWIGSFEEFNIYQGAMSASMISQHADEYLSESDARLASLTSSVGNVVPNASGGSTHFAVLVPDGTASVVLTATPFVSTATVTGDGEVDLSGGETTVTIEVTSADGTVSKQFTVDIVFEDPTCADNLNENNLVADPEMTDMSKWQGWGSKGIVYGLEAYCGGSSMKIGTGDTGCDAALDIAPFDFQPNTTYRVRAMVKTIDGSIGFLAKGADPDFGYAINTNGEWAQIDTTFTTGENPTDNFISFNKCDFGSNCTYAYVDNYEIFVDDGTAAIDFSDASIKVYPTYTSGSFNIETDGSRGMITVYNLLGKLVAQKVIESSRETITVNDAGMYIMRVECEDASATFKVFKTE